MPPPLLIDLPGYAFEMILVHGGAFRMGSPEGAEGAYDDEYPAHDVTVKDFYLGRYPVTQALWRAVALAVPEFGLEPDPSGFKGDERPVENVSWNDIKKKFLPAIEKLTGRSFRLPTESEWEYAAQGGPYHAEGYQYAGSDKLREVGWYDDNSGNETHPVGLLYPNALGLYDMSGNVWEWCEDDWHSNYEGAPDDGSAWIERPERGGRRVRRGGSFFYGPQFCRVAYRLNDYPATRHDGGGFRLASPFQSG
ncbi:MAG: formylglycine-generating enzyme family protein [Saprospiraceae bacterium]|nr:formylglycine-generating enzyme family protein [Saprospiraceae bacterium]